LVEKKEASSMTGVSSAAVAVAVSAVTTGSVRITLTVEGSTVAESIVVESIIAESTSGALTPADRPADWFADRVADSSARETLVPSLRGVTAGTFVGSAAVTGVPAVSAVYGLASVLFTTTMVPS
jgi:hypothetical protein